MAIASLAAIPELDKLLRFGMMILSEAIAIFVVNLELVPPKHLQFGVAFAKLIPLDAKLAIGGWTEDSTPLHLEPLLVRGVAFHQAKLTSCLDITIHLDAVIVALAHFLPLELLFAIHLEPLSTEPHPLLSVVVVVVLVLLPTTSIQHAAFGTCILIMLVSGISFKEIGSVGVECGGQCGVSGGFVIIGGTQNSRDEWLGLHHGRNYCHEVEE